MLLTAFDRLFIFHYVLNVKAFTLAFAQDQITIGEDIVVLWDQQGAKLQQFTLQLIVALQSAPWLPVEAFID